MSRPFRSIASYLPRLAAEQPDALAIALLKSGAVPVMVGPGIGLGSLKTCLAEGARVVTPYGATESLPVTSISSDEVLRETRARTDVGAGVCVELEPYASADDTLTAEPEDLGAEYEHTRGIETVLYHPGFPVDIRHNAKIGREKLALWAARRMPSSPRTAPVDGS